MHKEKAYSDSFLAIVGDGAIATRGWGEGNLIPVIIVDTLENLDVENLISIHCDIPLGDVTTTWARQRFNSSTIYLKLEFLKPLKTTAYIPFELSKHSALLNGIIISHAMYLQTSKAGLKVSEGIDQPKILIEVASELKNWPSIYKKALVKKFKKLKYSRKDSNDLAEKQITSVNELWSKHFR